MKRKLSSIVLCVIFVITFAMPVFATELGTLSYWYSNDNKIKRWSSTPDVFTFDLSGNFTDFSTYSSHARSQWSSAGVSTNSVDSTIGAEIDFLGGTYNDLTTYFDSLSSSDTGITRTTYSYEGEWTYSGTDKDGYVLSYAICGIVDKGRTADQYKNTCMHELGHALGWSGHSSNSSDVMYAYATTITSLTSRDKNHLNQVY